MKDYKTTNRSFKVGLAALVITMLVWAPAMSSEAAEEVNVWWPVNGVTVTGQQPFKAMVPGQAIEQYQMYWQVDGGQMNLMQNDYRDYPHKEAGVDLSGWNWKGSGPYNINFVARDKDNKLIGQKSVGIYVGSAQSVTALKTVTPTPTPAPLAIAGSKLYVNPNSEPKKWADANRWRPYEAGLMDKIANQPEVQWFGNWNNNVWNDVNNTTTTITNSGALPVYVIYNIPQRDCGGYSAGGSSSGDAYESWVGSVADAIGNRKAMVIVEPDALAGMDCLTEDGKRSRVELIKNAVATLKSKGNIRVYIDAGHPGWKTPSDIADKLRQAGIDQADGFSLNVSNFYANENIKNYGSQVSALVGGKHFVADTGRNGNGPAANNEWCNPWGRALGTPPTTSTDHHLIDAYLWVRGPSGSDGTCNGGPSAGTFWPEYGLELAKNTRW